MVILKKMTAKTCFCPKCGDYIPDWETKKTRAYCRPCWAAYSKEWRAKNPGKQRLYNQHSYKRNIRQMLLHGAKKRSQMRDRPFNLTIEDIQIPECCPILGLKLEVCQGGPLKDRVPKWADNSPTLDCIDPAKGYVKGNVWIISWRANHIKNDASPEELITIAKAVRNKIIEG